MAMPTSLVATHDAIVAHEEKIAQAASTASRTTSGSGTIDDGSGGGGGGDGGLSFSTEFDSSVFDDTTATSYSSTTRSSQRPSTTMNAAVRTWRPSNSAGEEKFNADMAAWPFRYEDVHASVRILPGPGCFVAKLERLGEVLPASRRLTGPSGSSVVQ